MVSRMVTVSNPSGFHIRPAGVLVKAAEHCSSKVEIIYEYNIINARQNLNRPVIVNTNLTLKEIEQRYSQRTLSRLSVYRCLKFAGTDVRQLKLREQYGLS